MTFPHIHSTGAMKYGAAMGVLLAAVLLARGEMRTWTSQTGRTLEGEYVSMAFDSVNIENASGELIKIPVETLSDEDRNYVELLNPPRLSVDFVDSSKQVFVKASPLWGDNSPITVLDYSFRAKVKQLDTREYNHELVLEWYAFSQQVWDLDKYKLVQKYTSKPFILSKKQREFEFRSPGKVRLYKITIDQGTGAALPRGQKFAESLVLVRDTRGEIIAYNSTKKWLYENLDKLEKLPVNAWLDNNCVRVHPTSPPPIKLGYMPGDY